MNIWAKIQTLVDKKTVSELKSLEQLIRPLSNGANIHQLKNLLSRLIGYQEILSDGGDVNKSYINNLKKDCLKFYKRNSKG